MSTNKRLDSTIEKAMTLPMLCFRGLFRLQSGLDLAVGDVDKLSHRLVEFPKFVCHDRPFILQREPTQRPFSRADVSCLR